MSSAGVMDLEVPPVEVTKPRIPVQRRILIADDNEMASRQLHKLLDAGPHFEVDEVATGTHALESLLKHNYSLSSPTCACRAWTAWS